MAAGHPRVLWGAGSVSSIFDQLHLPEMLGNRLLESSGCACPPLAALEESDAFSCQQCALLMGTANDIDINDECGGRTGWRSFCRSVVTADVDRGDTVVLVTPARR